MPIKLDEPVISTNKTFHITLIPAERNAMLIALWPAQFSNFINNNTKLCLMAGALRLEDGVRGFSFNHICSTMLNDLFSLSTRISTFSGYAAFNVLQQ